MSETRPWGEGYEDDVLREACGVAGVIVFDQTYPVGVAACGLVREIQHRGEDTAGLAVGNGDHPGFDFKVMKGEGLVSEVFRDGGRSADTWYNSATTAVAHVRYGTAGGSAFNLAQPILAGNEAGASGIVLAHNGHIEDMDMVASEYGVSLDGCNGDSEALARTISHVAGRSTRGDVLAAMHKVLPNLDGGFSLVVADNAGRLHGVRDPWGTRPLAVGSMAGNGFAFASETSAFKALSGITKVREVNPGEIVTITNTGEEVSSQLNRAPDVGGLCALEPVYFSREDSILRGRQVYGSRIEMGRRLAEEHPVEADAVVGVPNSGLVAAKGYAEALGMPNVPGLFRDGYSTRSFIQATQQERSQAVRNKLRPNTYELEGKRIVVVDDSIVRGTSTRALGKMLREAGAVEVHMRISSAPNRNPCFSGIATGNPKELLARRITTVKGMQEYLGLNSLGFLSVEALAESIGGRVGSLCMACMTGEYPYDTPEDPGRMLLRSKASVITP